MKRIHVFQHVPFETPGCILNWTQDMGYPVTSTRFYDGEPLPDINSIDWLVVMGGPMSVHDTGEYPWLIDEKRFVATAVSSGKCVIGICLGSQLIAEVLGGVIRRNWSKEIGWHRVFRTDESAGAGIFNAIPDGAEVFHWHGETFDIPPGAIHWMTSDCCRNQAFLFEERVLGLQFHLEVTHHLLHEMIDNCRGELIPGGFVQDEAEILNGMKHLRECNSIMYSMLDMLDSAAF